MANPSPRRRLRWRPVARTVNAVRRYGFSRLASGAISVALLLSVFSAIIGTNNVRKPRLQHKSSSKDSSIVGSIIASNEIPAVKPQYLMRIRLNNVTASTVDKKRFVLRVGTQLVLGGKRFEFAGASNYYMMSRAVDPTTRPQVIEVMQQAQQLGLNVLRVWAFNDGDGWQALQPRQGFLDVNALIEGLDWLISEAPKYGLRLVLVLTDSQDGYGGMGQYVKWAAPSLRTLQDFYRGRAIRRAFKAYIGALVLRKNSYSNVYYRDDPAIMGWEIANAPVCPGDDSGNILQEWIDDVAAYVKILDPNHLVMLGHSGLFGASTPDRWHANPATMSVGQPVAPWAHAYDAVCEGADWARNHRSPHIDVAAIQLWPDDWASSPEAWKLQWVRQWIREHVAVAKQLKKPLVITAFSKQRRSGPSTMATRNAMFDLVHQEASRTPLIAGTLFWLLASNTYPDYDGYTVYTSKVASQQLAPAWPLMSPEQALSGYRRRVFVDWERMLRCGSKRALGNTTADVPIDADSPDTNNWVNGWAEVLDVINSHSQVMAELSGTPLSKAAMSHPKVPRRRYVSPLLRKGDVVPLAAIPEDYISHVAVHKTRRQRGGIKIPGLMTGGIRDQSSKISTAEAAVAMARGASMQGKPKGGKGVSGSGFPPLNETEAAQIDFDDLEADADVSGSFLSRLGNTLGLSAVFGGGKALDDFDQDGSRGGGAQPPADAFSLDGAEDGGQALAAEDGSVIGNMKSWLLPSDKGSTATKTVSG